MRCGEERQTDEERQKGCMYVVGFHEAAVDEGGYLATADARDEREKQTMKPVETRGGRRQRVRSSSGWGT